jgi:hypothetical protein
MLSPVVIILQVDIDKVKVYQTFQFVIMTKSLDIN